MGLSKKESLGKFELAREDEYFTKENLIQEDLFF